MRRQSGANSLVIWYDAITKDGKLEWQDTLNSNNDCFLTACDGLFTNYTWKADFPRQAAAVAGRRKADVYFGAAPHQQRCVLHVYLVHCIVVPVRWLVPSLPYDYIASAVTPSYLSGASFGGICCAHTAVLHAIASSAMDLRVCCLPVKCLQCF